MLKRIIVIAFFTGMGQLFSVFALKFVSQHGSPDELKSIAQIDSLILFIMNVIALGLQSAAMRDLALTDDWKKKYTDIQSARITLGFLLMILAGLAFINKYYLLFLFAPIFAWSGDYALYARNRAVAGSIISFVRLLIPFSVIVILVNYQPQSIPAFYLLSIIIVYTLTNLIISWRLKTEFVFIPRFKNLRLYIQSLYLGIVGILLYFIGVGLLLIIPYFYSSLVVATAFIGLKFYIMYKGVLRIIHQAFIKDMLTESVCLKVDELSIIAGVAFAGSVLLFPTSFITLFFGAKFFIAKDFFILIAIAALVYSLFLSMATKSMLENRDKEYAIITSIAAGITIICAVLFSYWMQSVTSIGISLIIGEATWAIGLIRTSAKENQVRNRLLFLFQALLFLLGPLIIRYLWNDSIYAYLFSFAFFGGLLLIANYKKFRLLSPS
jgi:hypothetical protein